MNTEGITHVYVHEASVKLFLFSTFVPACIFIKNKNKKFTSQYNTCCLLSSQWRSGCFKVLIEAQPWSRRTKNWKYWKFWNITVYHVLELKSNEVLMHHATLWRMGVVVNESLVSKRLKCFLCPVEILWFTFKKCLVLQRAKKNPYEPLLEADKY